MIQKESTLHLCINLKANGETSIDRFFPSEGQTLAELLKTQLKNFACQRFTYTPSKEVFEGVARFNPEAISLVCLACSFGQVYRYVDGVPICECGQSASTIGSHLMRFQISEEDLAVCRLLTFELGRCAAHCGVDSAQAKYISDVRNKSLII